MKDKTEHAPVVIYSFVAGGSASRLCQALKKRGHDAREFSLFSLPQMRRLRARGPLLRKAAKFTGYSLFPLLAVVHSLSTRRAVLLSTTNPFFLPSLLSLSQRWQGKPVVVWLYDWLPSTVAAAFPVCNNALCATLIDKIAYSQVHGASAVVMLGQHMCSLVNKKFLLRHSAIIETGAQSQEFSNKPLENKNRPVLVSYVGNLGRIHDAQTLAAGIAAWATQSQNEAQLEFVLSLSGVQASRLQKALRHHCEVQFLSALSDKDWSELLSRTDVALVSLKKEAWQAPIPSKTFSAMAAGCAIVAVAPARSELATLVRDNACGVVVEPGDSQAFVNALKQFTQNRDKLLAAQKAALSWHKKKYDMDILAERWGCLLDELWQQQRQEHFVSPGQSLLAGHVRRYKGAIFGDL